MLCGCLPLLSSSPRKSTKTIWLHVTAYIIPAPPHGTQQTSPTWEVFHKFLCKNNFACSFWLPLTGVNACMQQPRKEKSWGNWWMWELVWYRRGGWMLHPSPFLLELQRKSVYVSCQCQSESNYTSTYMVLYLLKRDWTLFDANPTAVRESRSSFTFQGYQTDFLKKLLQIGCFSMREKTKFVSFI